jgi:predicted AlkP superfamily pyrophosphatase or phosphodiesterase
MDSKAINRKLLLCYISGLDLRRINAVTTPFISESLSTFPWVYIKNYPSNDLMPTILTGTYPPEHGMWGVKLKDKFSESLASKLTNLLPDIATTTIQCLLHFLTGSFDLAAIPPRRRGLFELKRTKYVRRTRLTEALLTIGGVESCLSIVGMEKSRYFFSNTSDPNGNLLSKLASGSYLLEILELYSLDLVQQWNLDRAPMVGKFYSRIDRFLSSLHERCKNSNTTLAILSDHGHEEIKGSIDITRELRKLNLSQDEYSFFIDVSMARFWFSSDRAREKVIAMLSEIGNTTLLTPQDMERYHLSFPDKKYGEVFATTEPGYIFFPHDFYQSLANLFLGLYDSRQRSRLWNPRHRGTHGYLPQHESEKGIMIVFNKNYRSSKEQIELIDVAPSILGILGYKKPEFMKGLPVFHAWINK